MHKKERGFSFAVNDEDKCRKSLGQVRTVHLLGSFVRSPSVRFP